MLGQPLVRFTNFLRDIEAHPGVQLFVFVIGRKGRYTSSSAVALSDAHAMLRVAGTADAPLATAEMQWRRPKTRQCADRGHAGRSWTLACAPAVRKKAPAWLRERRGRGGPNAPRRH